MNKTLYIIRHGQTDFNLQGIVQGQGMNTSLNEQGEAQAKAFFRKYRDEGFEVIFTSSLQRTHQTVAPFVNELGLPEIRLAAFDEFNWGIFEGSSFGKFNAEYRALLAAWRAGDYQVAPPGGDAPAQVAIRQLQGLRDIYAHPAQKILLCMHGRAMRLLLCLLLNRPYSEMDDFEHDNLSLYKLQLKEVGNELLLRNDRSHLD
jgi:probable phosphoglycerate mutase